MKGRNRGGHAPIALVLDQAERAGLGHHEIDPGNPRIGLSKLIPQDLSCLLGQCIHIFTVGVFRKMSIEQLGDLLFTLVDRRHDNMGGCLTRQLEDKFSQITLQHLDPTLFHVVVEINLLRDHRLAFYHRPCTGLRQQLMNQRIGLFPILGPVNLDAVLDQLLLQFLQQGRKVPQRMGTNCIGTLSFVQQLFLIGKLLQSILHQHVHR